MQGLRAFWAIFSEWAGMAVPKRIYNSHYGNVAPAMFTSEWCPVER